MHRVLRVVSVLVCVGLLLGGCGAREVENPYENPGAGGREWAKRSPLPLPSDGVVGSPRVVNAAGVPEKKVAAYVEAARKFYRAALADDCDVAWAMVNGVIRGSHGKKILCGWELSSLARFDIAQGDLSFDEPVGVLLSFEEPLSGGARALAHIYFERVNGKIRVVDLGVISI